MRLILVVVAALLVGCGSPAVAPSGAPSVASTAHASPSLAPTATAHPLATETSIGRVFALAMDAHDRLYIADNDAARIYRLESGRLVPFAGNGREGSSGDGGPAIAASIGGLNGLAVDRAGNVYLSEFQNSRIRRIAVDTGVITTIAGNGQRGFSGDGGPATSAQIENPAGMALDATGALYFATGHRIRKVDSSGRISTIAGTGEDGFNGDGIKATTAKLTGPHGVVVGPGGDLFVADSYGFRIRRIDPTTGNISTIAGTGEQGYSGDGGPAIAAKISVVRRPAFDAAGDLILGVGEPNLPGDQHRIRKIDMKAGVISTIAGTGTAGRAGNGGPAAQAQVNGPDAFVFDKSGNLYFAESAQRLVRKIDTANVISIVAGR